jgi:hypothetical protein
MYDEQMEQEKFIKIIGGIQKADRLQQIWGNSYPHSTSNIFKPTTKEMDFSNQAKNEGFSERQIKAFLNLR